MRTFVILAKAASLACCSSNAEFHSGIITFSQTMQQSMSLVKLKQQCRTVLRRHSESLVKPYMTV